MNKKGFTLIELLAVIVVIAVIALITVPMIVGVVDKARKEAFKDSVFSIFGQIEYYMMENNLTELPKEGIEVKNLNIKKNPFQYGIIRRNKNGILIVEDVSDGSYCAMGPMNDLNITKGECDTGAPTGKIVVEKKKATITLKDDQGIVGYEITKNEEASSWTTIEAVKEIVIEYEASEPATYYVHIKDKFGKTSRISFVIENSAFSYEATVTTNTYDAVDIGHKHTGSATEGGGCYTAIPHVHSSSCYRTQGWQGNGSSGITTDSCGCRHQTHYWRCPVCGATATSQTNVSSSCTQGHSLSDRYAPSHSHSVLNCSKTVDGYKLSCGKTESVEYTCPQGGTLSGTTCTKIDYSCPNGGNLNGTMCEF